MPNFNRETLLVCLRIFVVVLGASGQDILGCGGFIKSDIAINFSSVNLKLYSKQGSLKFQTDCAPNNGYYLIPLYDKGDYVIQVEPPAGWSFEPNRIALHVDGATDPCSQGKDINFYFRGFSILGKVISRGTSEGPAGVTIRLKKQSESEILQQTTSIALGKYSFSNVYPGNYIITAFHSRWEFFVSEVKVQVESDNGHANDALVLAGYDVRGRVTSEGEPIKGVNFILFSVDGSKPRVAGCLTGSRSSMTTFLESYRDVKKREFLCHVASLTDGSFSFPVVPPGKYALVPFYKGENIKFDVNPAEIQFKIEHDSLTLEEAFKVEGFSVGGRVIASIGGKGISGARVLLNGKQLTETTEEGRFHLENMKAGSYQLQVIKENINFDVVDVKITPNTPHLPEIIAKSFRVCGHLEVVHLPSGLDINSRRLVHLENKNSNGDPFATRTGENGRFCIYVARGYYRVKPSVAEAEAAAGLQFQPVTHDVEVDDIPPADLVFKQLFAVVRGTVKCRVPCHDIQVTLKPLDLIHRELVKHALVVDNAFLFEAVLPGRYEVSVLKESWCWAEKMIEIRVDKLKTESLEFEHSGYSILIDSSHETELVYTSKGSSGVISVQKGENRHCVSNEGDYEMVPRGCHVFTKKKYNFSTGKIVTFKLIASHHLITGTIVSNENITNLSLQVTSEDKDNGEITKLVVPILLDRQPNQYFKYQISYWSYPGEKLIFMPLAKKMLFYPSQKTIVAVDDCMINYMEFKAKNGLFVSGQIHPPLSEVKVTVTLDDNSIEPLVVYTGNDGKYSAGPLHAHRQYVVNASKEGYLLTKKDDKGDFTAFKLAKVIVTVTSNEGQPLSGVLLSLSGGTDYRQNSLTQQNGTMHFTELFPGQYFLRPMLKEFSFDPPSTIVEIKQGTIIDLRLKGQRVAYSCFGSVTSLTGDAEQGIIVEAVGLNECQAYQEEVASESDGSFRIRGLQPRCTYTIRIKLAQDTNQQIERSTPESHTVIIADGDIIGLQLIVFRHFNQMDISGNVVTLPENLPSLKVLLHKDDNLDQMVHTLSLSVSSFFQFSSVPLDGRTYVIKLETTFSRASHDYDLDQVILKANTSYRHISLHFSPSPRHLEHDVHQSFSLALPLTFVAIVSIFCYRSLSPMFMQAGDLIQSFVGSEGTSNEGAERKRRAKIRKVQ